ncbi:MAG: hypothetical protein IH888_08130 [Planctomycetes bacterium]|nr:hypothetical protein [Planctomycetota bacterium]
MSLTKQAGLLVGAVALTLTGGSYADTTSQATNDELKARVAELESRLSAVEAGKSNHWLTERRADEIRGLIGDVLADADTRASLLAQGMTAGYQDGALIQSSDGNWSLKTNIHMQQRFVYNSQDPAAAGADDDRVGFENTRTKFILSGNVVSPDWYYKFEVNFGSHGGTVFDEDDRTDTGDAYIGYDYGNGWGIKVGTYKAPFLREEMVDSRYQLAVERSLVNYIFTGGRTDGVSANWESDQFRVDFGINDGINSGQSAFGTPDVDFAISARGEWLVMGNWDQFMDFTSPSGSETGLLVGAAFHWETNEDDAAPAAFDADTVLFTVDGSYEAGGWNVYGAFMYKSVEDPSGVGVEPDQTGIMFQGGYYFTDEWEGFARYEWADLDTVGADDVSILTFGVNRYFDGHNAKWTTDLGFALDGIDASVSTADGDITGFKADAAGDDGQFVLRSQLQIVF